MSIHKKNLLVNTIKKIITDSITKYIYGKQTNRPMEISIQFPNQK
jgi:hypothetical protein